MTMNRDNSILPTQSQQDDKFMNMNNIENCKELDKSFKMLMKNTGFVYYSHSDHTSENNNHNHNDKSIIPENIPDKYDIIAGLILTAAISASIFSISTISYYVVMSMYNYGLITSAETIICSKIGTKIETVIEENSGKLLKLFENELKWVFDHNLLTLAGTELKAMHSKIKIFLIEHSF